MKSKSINYYKVGGCIRDKIINQLLNKDIKIKDYDFVVTGATKEDMLNLGYIPIGKDFPVFLHPKTNEEYALARTERSTGIGHNMFICRTEHVSLEEDLSRRDITINAIAEDINGNLIDPFGGYQDIKNQIIRHVSHAFVEDPLRILRVARFATLLNFTVASETMKLMKRMSEGKLLQALPQERIYTEIIKASNNNNFYKFLEVLKESNNMKFVFPNLENILSMTNLPISFSFCETSLENLAMILILEIISNSTTTNYHLEESFPFLKEQSYKKKLKLIYAIITHALSGYSYGNNTIKSLMVISNQLRNMTDCKILDMVAKISKNLDKRPYDTINTFLMTLKKIQQTIQQQDFTTSPATKIIQQKYSIIEKIYYDFYLTIK